VFNSKYKPTTQFTNTTKQPTTSRQDLSQCASHHVCFNIHFPNTTPCTDALNFRKHIKGTQNNTLNLEEIAQCRRANVEWLLFGNCMLSVDNLTQDHGSSRYLFQFLFQLKLSSFAAFTQMVQEG